MTSVHAIGVPYVDHRDKVKLCVPDKTFEKNGPQWKLQRTNGDILAHSVRQEEDIYDPNLQLFYKAPDRGISKPPPLKFNMRSLSTSGAEGRTMLREAIKKQGKLSLRTEHKWIPNNNFPKLLGQVETEHKFQEIINGDKVTYKDLGPLITDPFDDSRKLRTLDRNNDTMPWFYSRTVPDNLHGSVIERDLAKGKILKKKLRQLRRSTMRDQSGSVLPSLKNAKNRGAILQSGSLTGSRIFNQ